MTAAGVRIAPAGADDAPFLRRMLVAAAFWRPDGRCGSVDEVMADPALARYVAGWPRPGDLGMIARDDGRMGAAAAGSPVGAAWLRLLPADEAGYGFVDESTPELSIGVVRDRRGAGVGAALLAALAEAARKQGVAAVSLSVEADNPAERLYRRAGFAVVGGSGGALTMVLRL